MWGLHECEKCGADCTFREDNHEWWCRSSPIVLKIKKRCHCNCTISDYKGSFLGEVRLPTQKTVVFLNHWLQKTWDHLTVIQCLEYFPGKSIEWRSFCSEVTDLFPNQTSIDDPRISIEIDKTIIIKRKYERGLALPKCGSLQALNGPPKKHFVVPLTWPQRGQRGEIKEHLYPSCSSIYGLGLQSSVISGVPTLQSVSHALPDRRVSNSYN